MSLTGTLGGEDPGEDSAVDIVEFVSRLPQHLGPGDDKLSVGKDRNIRIGRARSNSGGFNDYFGSRFLQLHNAPHQFWLFALQAFQ
ncbi:hypothetical protein ACFSZS_14055 [Seohaeicola zhoushanensis]